MYDDFSIFDKKITNMRYLTGIVFLLVFSLHSIANTQLSEEAELSLLTCSPGDELYSLFGHSAIRVNDPIVGLDVVFGYGTFDFDTPNFYLKFGNGNLNYWIDTKSYAGFIRQYNYYKQNVTEHRLNLSQNEKQRLMDALVINLQEENRYYRYDFFFDNCATRIRDIIIKNIDGEVVYSGSVEEMTFRDMLHQYSIYVPWISDGLDILLGLKTDDKADWKNQMFLPDYLLKHFSNAKVINNGVSKPLLDSGKVIISFDINKGASFITPAQLFWVLFIISLLLLYYEIKKRKKPVVFINRILLLISGGVGALIFFLWFLSRHSVTGDNFNMLWAIPFNLFLAFFPAWFFKSLPFKIYLVFIALCALITAVAGYFLPQYLPPVILPLSLLLTVRYISWLYFNTRNTRVLS